MNGTGTSYAESTAKQRMTKYHPQKSLSSNARSAVRGLSHYSKQTGGALQYTTSPRLNTGGVYFKLGLIDPAIIRTQGLFGAWHLFIKCIFQPSIFYGQYRRFIELRTKHRQNVNQCHQLCLISVNLVCH